MNIDFYISRLNVLILLISIGFYSHLNILSPPLLPPSPFSAVTLYLGLALSFHSGFMLLYLCFLDNWWSQVCPRYFLRLVDLYKGAVVYLLSGRKTLLIPVLFSSYITAALRLLEKLHKVREELGFMLAHSDSQW